MKHLSTYILLCILFVGHNLKSQEQPLYSQFTFNKYLFNPAVAGSEQTSIIKLAAYEQWVGFKGAPKYHTASFDTRIFEQSRKPRRNVRKKFKLFKPGSLGAGVQIFNERYGVLSHTGINLTYSYHMKLGNNQLSFGLSPVLSNVGISSNDMILSDEQTDLLLLGDNTRRWVMDFNFGVYYKSQDYFVGYSTHHLSRSGLQWGGSIDKDYSLGRQHYLMGGYKYIPSSKFEIEPAMLIKLSETHRSENQIDISVKAIYNRVYWGGLSYKTSKTLAIFGGIKLDRYYFAYSFDLNMGEVRKTTYGSHEILLAVQLGESSHRYRWLNVY